MKPNSITSFNTYLVRTPLYPINFYTDLLNNYTSEKLFKILQKLVNFEIQKGYINSSITIQSLAQDFNTNSKYLSSIINNNINKSFTHYINDLRIDNIINELKNSNKLRKYTIASIAEEAGFNTGESFSKAFFKRSGIKPVYFIKKLNEL